MPKKTVGRTPLSKKTLNEEIHNEKYTIKYDLFDLESFQTMLKTNEKLRETLHEGMKDYKPFDDLLQDTFSALYKYNPELFKDYQIKPENRLNKAIMDEVVEAPKYKDLRALTRLDEVNSTVGTEILSDELKEIAKKLKEQQEALQQMLDAAKAAADAQAAADASESSGDSKEAEEGEDGKPIPSPEKLTLEEAKKKLAEAEKNFKDSIEKKEFKQEIQSMINTAQGQTQETSDFIQAWGLGGDSNYTKKSYQGKMELLNRLRSSSKLKQIAQLAGRYKALAMKRQHQKIKKGSSELYSIKQGKNLERLLPSELMKISNPITKPLFFKDLFEGKLLEYETREKKKEQRGPLLILTDSSGSMSGAAEIYKY